MESSVLDEKMVEMIPSFWGSPQIQEIVLKRGDSLHIPGGIDGLGYHVSRLKEYLSTSFVPTDEDIIRVRIKTTGIIETTFVYEGMSFMVCDVGGQRSERRKWIQCFSKVDAIIFLVSTNEYDTNIEEATSYNSMIDSLQQFKIISELQIFTHIPFIVFFNKYDLFQDKISRFPLHVVFRDYKAFTDGIQGTEVEKGVAYFERNFRQNFGGTKFYSHTTCALDKDSCRKVFESIQDVIIKGALYSSGLNL
eukprot:TRINITY_DN850_c0_g1_i2.p1 TRINITY_DN850_c0_g1~~TRINITY_DN850_c0_g1_i2.p1  ORF type:complete len:250 (-),score=32.46 TRINITY_DN850_c0_g1_i2:48-797(-)